MVRLVEGPEAVGAPGCPQGGRDQREDVRDQERRQPRERGPDRHAAGGFALHRHHGRSTQAREVVVEVEVEIQHRRAEQDVVLVPVAADAAVHRGQEPEAGQDQRQPPAVDPAAAGRAERENDGRDRGDREGRGQERRGSARVPGDLRGPASRSQCQQDDVRAGRPADAWQLEPLDHEGDALSAADAERGQPVAEAAGAQRVEQRDQDARAGRADRVAERDGAAVHVHALGVQLQLAQDGQALRGERLVQLEQVDAVGRAAPTSRAPCARPARARSPSPWDRPRPTRTRRCGRAAQRPATSRGRRS